MNQRASRYRTRAPARGPRRQRGIALFVALILLLILTLLGVTVTRMQTGEERMAQNDQNHQIALQAAEAALRYAEAGLRQGLFPVAQFSNNTAGLYVRPAAASVIDGMNWAAPGGATMAYAGPALAAVPISSAPVLIIELLPAVANNHEAISNPEYGANTQPPAVYRITAHGYGGDLTAGATLQSIYQL